MHPMALAFLIVGGLLLSIIDIAATFVLIRVIAPRCPTSKWLQAFNSAGKPLVDALFVAAEQMGMKLCGRRMREAAKPITCLAILFLSRCVIQGVLSTLTGGLMSGARH